MSCSGIVVFSFFIPCTKVATLKVIVAGRNPIQISRGIEKTAKALVSQLKLMSRKVDVTEFFLCSTLPMCTVSHSYYLK